MTSYAESVRDKWNGSASGVPEWKKMEIMNRALDTIDRLRVELTEKDSEIERLKTLLRGGGSVISLHLVDAEIERLTESIAYNKRRIWWGNFWLGYVKVLFGFFTACIVFHVQDRALWPWFGGLYAPLLAAWLVKDWVTKWKRIPEAK